MDLKRLSDTEAVRYCIDQLELWEETQHSDKPSIEGKIISFLYQINLVDGKVRPGVHREADTHAIQKFMSGATQLEFTESNSQEMCEILDVNWTYASTKITELIKRGIANRRAAGRKRYVSLRWDILLQLHEALTTGKILPAKHLVA